MNTISEQITDNDFSIDQLAKTVHLGQSQFARKLNSLIGLSPIKLIKQLRLQKAQSLLKDSNLSIANISYECGFKDPIYFTRVFKKEY